MIVGRIGKKNVAQRSSPTLNMGVQGGSEKFQNFATLPSRYVVLYTFGVMRGRSALACRPSLVRLASVRRQGVRQGAMSPRGYTHMDATELRLAKRWLLEDGKKQTEARRGMVPLAIVWCRGLATVPRHARGACVALAIAWCLGLAIVPRHARGACVAISLRC